MRGQKRCSDEADEQRRGKGLGGRRSRVPEERAAEDDEHERPEPGALAHSGQNHPRHDNRGDHAGHAEQFQDSLARGMPVGAQPDRDQIRDVLEKRPVADRGHQSPVVELAGEAAARVVVVRKAREQRVGPVHHEGRVAGDPRHCDPGDRRGRRTSRRPRRSRPTLTGLPPPSRRQRVPPHARRPHRRPRARHARARQPVRRAVPKHARSRR